MDATLPSILSDWFAARGWAPRRHQLEMLAAGRRGEHALLVAPTGAGKTLAGFLPSLAELIEAPADGLHTLYISPLKALAVDVQRNLLAPIEEMGIPIRVETRTGDTPWDRKVRQRARPPQILLTTPESLSLLLSYEDSLTMFAGLRTVVIDEVHAFATGKRGDLLALALARLQRFYDPDAGEVRVDGVPVRAADPADIRARMAMVPQETVIFGASARDNLRYGAWDATDDQIWAAAGAANAADFLRDLPQGLDTFLGEGGARLSGGQRQRVAIARALLRDAPILLLDEATSALDAESERLVQDALERLMANRTTLVIAHRLATVRAAGRIIVMDEGRIVETGSHAELVAKGGLYARLAALQFHEA